MDTWRGDKASMGKLPQLLMRHPDLTYLPPLALPYGCALRGHLNKTNDDEKWEKMVEAIFGGHFSFEKFISTRKGYQPEYLLYLNKLGKDIATVAAIENEKFPGEGYIHMVGTLPESRGIGAGRIIVLAALHSLSARGFKTAVLFTYDERIPAIKLYLSLGFEPVYTHESYEERWKRIYQKGVI